MATKYVKAAGLIAATAAAIGGSLVSAPAASASSPVSATGLYLVNSNSGKCLSPAGGRVDNNAFTVIFNCDTDPSRSWYLVNKGNDIYQILNLNSGKCLSPAGGAGTNNTETVIFNCDDDPSRRWYLVDKGNSRYHMVNYKSGKCLSPAGGGVLNNTPTVIFNCDTDPSRLWHLVAR
ncbi:RICIN domain-containing protein [Streptomyces sp. NPDC093149]|uniref:RICIN domain-containing protein n=1 Tax=Streptomyces sp. NPDC093149 TaxID=3366031 RepID=UPI0037F89070